MGQMPREALLEALEVLKMDFWGSRTGYEPEEDWRAQLDYWAQEHGFVWLQGLVEKLYPISEYERPCMIHGDPTLANCMSKNNELALIDPLPAIGKIPSYWEVDMGKLLQSALGWEHLLVSGIPLPWRGMASELLLYCSTQPSPRRAFNRCWFWCAVHCARIIPYAKEEKVLEWSRVNSQEAIRAVRV